MNKIQQIKLKNFKYFYGEINLDFNRQNVLIYGENGSGKSCLYWALYTFFQSVFKSDNKKIQKYFNPRHDENLRNRFAENDEESYIKIVFADEQQSITEKMISNRTVNTKKGNLVKQATQGGELMNYKLLSKIHDFKNSERMNLFPVIDKDILMFINFREPFVRHDETTGSTNAQDWWDYIKPGMQPRGKMHLTPYKTFKAAVDKFNEELQFYLDSIIESVNEYLEKFNQSFTVNFEYIRCTYDEFIEGSTTKRNHKTIPPKIYLNINFNHQDLDEIKREVTRPHTFLNEAKLTAIALSIRFAMLDQKISLVGDDTPKILILDDILISLDMSNRDKVLDIILNEFTNYQMVILSHDKHFFEMLRHKINKSTRDSWKYLEFYDSEENGIPQPYIHQSETYLDKAEKYFRLHEYEIAGNFLRKETEAICKEFLPKKYHFTEEYNLRDLNGLIIQLKSFVNQAGLDVVLFNELDAYRKFILNPTSHDSYNVPKFNREIEKCLKTLKQIRKIKNDIFLKRGAQIEFELTTEDGQDHYKFEIKLEDDFRLIKAPDKDSVISKGMVNYWVAKNNKKGDLQHCNTNIKAFYDKNYGKSDKRKNADFWEEVIMSNTGEKLRDERKF